MPEASSPAPAAAPVALVTGTRRIGAAVAIALADQGFDVAIAYRASSDAARTAARQVEAAGRRALVLEADVSDPAACRALVARTVSGLGRLDAVALLASRFVKRRFDDLDVAAWDASLAVDLSASFHCARAAVPHLRATRGQIVFCSDWVAASGRPRYRGFLPYYVAKRGVVALGEALALELAADGIRVHVVAPGPIVPIDGSSDSEQRAVLAATPLGRWGGEAEVARRVADLLATTFVTGETIRIDGGRHLA